MEVTFYLIIIPIIFGVFCLFAPKNVKGLSEAAALIASLITFGYAIYLFARGEVVVSNYLMVDPLSRFIILFTGFFAVVITLYSISFWGKREERNLFYAYTLWSLAGACGVLLSNHLILLLVFWGFLGLSLYLMIGLGGSNASDVSDTAKKTFIIIGGSDGIMTLGIAILWMLAGTCRMDKISINLIEHSTLLPIAGFLCLAIASFAKAGAMPFHTWIPDCAQHAPIPTTALLPASLDKLLGIYLLARTATNLFVMNRSMQMVLLVVGSLTIVAAVFMALIQHNYKKLLGYHAVSQVGYMVLGIGTGMPVGIAGGLFHMLNNAVYKSCLFLCGGAVEKKTGTDDMDKLGGLSRFMPLTFTTCLIAALAISGVPPLNGFMSKWMVYQGVIDLGRKGDKLWIIWLAAAMFGSALTMASFMKLIHAIFLGQQSKELAGREIKEAPWPMWTVMAILAVLCVLFGLFAKGFVLKPFIEPVVRNISYIGFWEPVLATLLLLIGLFAGGIIYFLGRPQSIRESDIFVGGEILEKGHEVSGVDFYRTIQEMEPFKFIYQKAEKKLFDIYDMGKKLVFSLSQVFQDLHTGVLPTYLIWSLAGLVILIIIFCKGGL